jgi:hypothetical protein
MAKPGGVDPATLEIGRRYRVDHRHERLRRTFRFTGTLLAIDIASDPDPASTETTILTFEEKPRFASATTHRIDLATLVAADPV